MTPHSGMATYYTTRPQRVMAITSNTSLGMICVMDTKGHPIETLSTDDFHARYEPEKVPPIRDWPEDASHENGRYQCRCCRCDRVFIGHKRRVVCKVCATSGTESSAGGPPKTCCASYSGIPATSSTEGFASTTTSAPAAVADGEPQSAEFNTVTGRLRCDGCGYDIEFLHQRWFHCTEGNSVLWCSDPRPALTAPQHKEPADADLLARIAALEGLMEKATKGEWVQRTDLGRPWSHDIYAGNPLASITDPNGFKREDDCAVSVALHNLAPDLIRLAKERINGK